MNVNRILEVKEREPIESLRGFLGGLWVQNDLVAMLAPAGDGQGSASLTREVTSLDEVAGIDPFTPLMRSNAALQAIRFMERYNDEPVAVILRPCELRAFFELRKRHEFPRELPEVTVIGVDCLGTYAEKDYQQLVEIAGVEATTRDVMQNAAEGGLRPQKFRMACQVCDWPAPRGADIVIGTIGVASDSFLLVITRDEKTDERLRIQSITDGKAGEYQVSRRETVVGAVADARAGMRKTFVDEVKSDCRFGDIGCFLAWFTNCSLCSECLRACPLFADQLSSLSSQERAMLKHSSALAELVMFSRWLASCAGCGMCEQACNRGVPLTLLLSALSHRIQSELSYASGDPNQGFPWK
jgi:formate dehydrogenase (coenzyme F420) beta subunit